MHISGFDEAVLNLNERLCFSLHLCIVDLVKQVQVGEETKRSLKDLFLQKC